MKCLQTYDNLFFKGNKNICLTIFVLFAICNLPNNSFAVKKDIKSALLNNLSQYGNNKDKEITKNPENINYESPKVDKTKEDEVNQSKDNNKSNTKEKKPSQIDLNIISSMVNFFSKLYSDIVKTFEETYMDFNSIHNKDIQSAIYKDLDLELLTVKQTKVKDNHNHAESTYLFLKSFLVIFFTEICAVNALKQKYTHSGNSIKNLFLYSFVIQSMIGIAFISISFHISFIIPSMLLGMIASTSWITISGYFLYKATAGTAYDEDYSDNKPSLNLNLKSRPQSIISILNDYYFVLFKSFILSSVKTITTLSFFMLSLAYSNYSFEIIAGGVLALLLSTSIFIILGILDKSYNNISFPYLFLITSFMYFGFAVDNLLNME